MSQVIAPIQEHRGHGHRGFTSTGAILILFILLVIIIGGAFC